MGHNAGARPAQLQANALAAQVAATIIKHTRFWLERKQECIVLVVLVLLYHYAQTRMVRR